MVTLRVKKHRQNYEVTVHYSENSKSHYRTEINNSAKQIGQVLIDLYLEGFPIEKAILIFKERFKNSDWLGL